LAGVAALPENLLDMSDVAAARQRFGDLLVADASSPTPMSAQSS